MGDNSKAEGYRRLHTALSTAITTESKDCQSESSEVDAFAKTEETNLESIETTVEGGTLIRMRLVRGTAVEDEFVDTRTPAITLNDVAGMDEVKRRLTLAFLAPMKNPDLMKMYAKSTRGGLLLYGPPSILWESSRTASSADLYARSGRPFLISILLRIACADAFIGSAITA
jgi:hypothetical protein